MRSHGVDVAGRRSIPGARRISDALGVPIDVAQHAPNELQGNGNGPEPPGSWLVLPAICR